MNDPLYLLLWIGSALPVPLACMAASWVGFVRRRWGWRPSRWVVGSALGYLAMTGVCVIANFVLPMLFTPGITVYTWMATQVLQQFSLAVFIGVLLWSGSAKHRQMDP